MYIIPSIDVYFVDLTLCHQNENGYDITKWKLRVTGFVLYPSVLTTNTQYWFLEDRTSFNVMIYTNLKLSLCFYNM